MSRPPGFLQVDVDGLWAVRRCYGRPEDDTFRDDPCWDEGVAVLEELLAAAGVPAGFFLVGRDLELAHKRRRARRLLRAGHELGNHSYTHRLGLTRATFGVLLSEVGRTDARLRQIGARPAGFRAPGYDVDARVLRAAARHGYLYDASLLPTALTPLLRAADLALSRRWIPGKRQFGRVAYGRAPRHPYFPRRHALRKPAQNPREATLLEIPVGTIPPWRLPLTGASLLVYTPSALRSLFARLAEPGLPVLLLLHAIDATDCRRPIVFGNRRPSLAGFDKSLAFKRRFLRTVIREFARAFAVERADAYALRRTEAGP